MFLVLSFDFSSIKSEKRAENVLGWLAPVGVGKWWGK
jgi:hypothetical protein